MRPLAPVVVGLADPRGLSTIFLQIFPRDRATSKIIVLAFIERQIIGKKNRAFRAQATTEIHTLANLRVLSLEES